MDRLGHSRGVFLVESTHDLLPLRFLCSRTFAKADVYGNFEFAAEIPERSFCLFVVIWLSEPEPFAGFFTGAVSTVVLLVCPFWPNYPTPHAAVSNRNCCSIVSSCLDFELLALPHRVSWLSCSVSK